MVLIYMFTYLSLAPKVRKNARTILKANLKYPDLEESNKAKIYVPTDAENATDEGTISNKTGKNKFQVNFVKFIY